MAEIKQEDHTCPMAQLVPCSDVNAVDRPGGRISPQIGAVLNLTVCSHRPLFIHVNSVLGHEQKKQQLVGRSQWQWKLEWRPTLYKTVLLTHIWPLLGRFFFSLHTATNIWCETWCQTWVWASQAVSGPSQNTGMGVTHSELRWSPFSNVKENRCTHWKLTMINLKCHTAVMCLTVRTQH